MNLAEQEERMAALLSALGPQVSDAVLADLPADVRTRLRELLDRFHDSPAASEEIEDTLDDFMRFFRFALDQSAEAPALSVYRPDDADHSGPGAEDEASNEPPVFEPTDDAVGDLERLRASQIAGALRNENAQTIALVLNCLSPQKAGHALQQLPAEIRSDVFLKLRKPPAAPASLIEKIVRTTVDKGCILTAEAVTDPEEEGNRKIAELLRASEPQARTEMLTALEANDPEVAAQIKQMLYVFEDLLRVSDRSMQKILSEVDSSPLATSLKEADERIVEKVMANLSKRARATLAEEIEYRGPVAPPELELAQKAVCEVIAKLDQAGDLEMEQ